LAAEAVQAAEREAAVVCARVLDRVVHTVSVVEVVEVARVSGDVAAPLVTCLERADEVDDGVVLATQRDRAVLARQADVSLTTEHQAALTELAGVHVETIFEHEDRLQAAAQIFGAAQAEAAALHHAAGQTVQMAALRVVVEDEAFIDDAVKGHAALRMGCASERAQRDEREKRLFH
jgi:hypothetical protein